MTKTGAISAVRSTVAFYPKKPAWPAQYPSIVIAVNDVKRSMERVSAAGGKVPSDPMEIPTRTVYSFIDTEGNSIRMLQPKVLTQHIFEKGRGKYNV